MVDFNNENTVGTKAVDIERVLILQRRDAVINSIEGYDKLKYGGASPPLSIIKARLKSLVNQLRGMYIRRHGQESLNIMLSKLDNKPTYKDLDELFNHLSLFLDGIQLTRLDNNIVYDTTDIEAENEIKGLD